MHYSEKFGKIHRFFHNLTINWFSLYKTRINKILSHARALRCKKKNEENFPSLLQVSPSTKSVAEILGFEEEKNFLIARKNGINYVIFGAAKGRLKWFNKNVSKLSHCSVNCIKGGKTSGDRKIALFSRIFFGTKYVLVFPKLEELFEWTLNSWQHVG